MHQLTSTLEILSIVSWVGVPHSVRILVSWSISDRESFSSIERTRVKLTVSPREESFPCQHLGHDTADRPEVH